MKKKLRSPVFVAAVILTLVNPNGYGSNEIENAKQTHSNQHIMLPVKNKKAFIQYMVTTHKLKRKTITQIIDSIKIRHSAEHHINHPAENQTWEQYEKQFVTPYRINKGIQFYQEHTKTLQKAESKFRVDPYTIVAILGVETNYGANTGSYRVLDALGTLAFSTKNKDRSYFFQDQLKDFIILAENKKAFDVYKTKGSYAGAIGIPQFMPSSYIAYSIRFKQDNHSSNLFNKDDAIMSVANYLNKHGWVHKEFIERKLTQKELANLKTKNNRPKNIIELNEKDQAKEYRVISSNFKAIMSYNPKYNYAMAVSTLSDKIRAQTHTQKSDDRS